jgi:hypothetical protein
VKKQPNQLAYLTGYCLGAATGLRQAEERKARLSKKKTD